MTNIFFDCMTKLVLLGKFEAAAEIFLPFTKDEIVEKKLDFVATDISYDGHICGYGFACFLAHLCETVERHIDITVTLEIGMPYLNGAYQASLYHAFRVIEFNPDNELAYQHVISIYGVPEGRVSKEEAREVSKEVLKKWPKNNGALSTLEETNGLEAKKYPSIAQSIQVLIAKDVKAALKTLILRGRFIETRNILGSFSWDEIYQILLGIAREERNVCAYDYMWFLMREHGETAERQLITAEISILLFKRIEGAWWNVEAGAAELYFFHIHRAAGLAPDDMEIQEKLLALYVPGGLSFDAQEAQEIAKRVLFQNPESEAAQKVLAAAVG